MANNKVVFGNQTLMDITDTTATEDDVMTGKTFYKASGQRSSGSLDPVVDVSYANGDLTYETATGDSETILSADDTEGGTASSDDLITSGAVRAAINKILGDLAVIETTAIASRAYSVGDYLILNGTLYRVKTAIASGGTITVGTNVVATTVSKEVNDATLWKESIAVASTGGSAGTLLTIVDARITADHVLTKFVAANQSYITSDITCVTSEGQAVITGISTAATTAEICLERKRDL